MPTRSIVLTDAAEGVWSETFELRESAGLRLAGGSDWSVRKRTLRGGVSEGVDVVDLHNGALSVSILPTRGMGLWRGSYRGIPIGWSSPVKQPVNPCYVNQTDRNGLGWLTGFNELLCRCGLSSNGAPGLDVIVDNTGQKTEAPLTLHGKIANIPAHSVEVAVSTEGNGLLSVSGTVDETMLFGPCLRLKTTYETVPGSNRLTIRDEVVNVAGRPMELELLYHTNLGKPFLESGARLVLPFREAAPRDPRAAEDVKTWQTYLGPTPGYAEQCYFADLIGNDQEKTVVLFAQCRRRPGREPGIQHPRTAVLHGLEVHSGRSRRLRDGAGAGDQFAQSQNVRAETGARHHPGAGGVARFADRSGRAHFNSGGGRGGKENRRTAEPGASHRSRTADQQILADVEAVSKGEHRSWVACRAGVRHSWRRAEGSASAGRPTS